jgi:choline transport protein
MILSIVKLWYPDYEIQHWHQWMIYCALIWLAIFLNIFGSNLIPLFNQMIFVLAVLTLSATTIVLFICSRNHFPSGSWIFTDTSSSTGWKQEGFGFILAISNAVYAFLGSDAGAHLCEEIHNPGRNVPKVMLYPLAMGLVTAFPFAIACMSSIVNIEDVIGTATGIVPLFYKQLWRCSNFKPGLPLIEIYYQGTGSKAGASVLMALFAFCFFACLVGNGA